MSESESGASDFPADSDEGSSHSEDLLHPPASRFVTCTDGLPDTESAQWSQVMIEEPKHVADWLYYLHHTEDEAFLDLITVLLQNIVKATHNEEPLCWPALVKTNLPTVLMNILLDPEMFSQEEDALKVRTL